MYNFNVSWQFQADQQGRLSWDAKPPYTNEWLPYQNSLYMTMQKVAGTEGMYVIAKRLKNDEDKGKEMLDSYQDFRFKVLPRGNRGRGKRRIKGVFYPRCKKTAGTGLANMWGVNTIGGILTKMEPKGENYFRYDIGFGPIVGLPKATDKTEAEFYSVVYEYVLYTEMTFSERKDPNLVQ